MSTAPRVLGAPSPKTKDAVDVDIDLARIVVPIVPPQHRAGGAGPWIARARSGAELLDRLRPNLGRRRSAPAWITAVLRPRRFNHWRGALAKAVRMRLEPLLRHAGLRAQVEVPHSRERNAPDSGGHGLC